MNEGSQAAILIGIVALIGFGGLYITGGIPFLEEPFPAGFFLGDVYVESYQADLYLNGTLSEEFDYRIKKSGAYRMLYRNWKMPLSAEHMVLPYIEPLEILPTPGAVPYVKDNTGAVQILSPADSRYKSEVASLAERNEAGGYYPQRFTAGQYQMEYLFRIHPYLECDQEFCHWNLMLADEHLPYRQIEIRIHDPDDLIVELFTHPQMRMQKEDKMWVITGGSPKDELIEVEMLLVPGAKEGIGGFPREVSECLSEDHLRPGRGLKPIARAALFGGSTAVAIDSHLPVNWPGEEIYRAQGSFHPAQQETSLAG